MPFTVTIPKKKSDAEKTIKLILAQGKSKRSAQSIRWWICRWYMRGVRNFKQINYQEGSIQVSYYDEEGVLNFQYEDIVSKFQAQKGRLMGVNLRPVVTKEGMSLDGLRKASIGQVVLDTAFPGPKVENIQDESVTDTLLYGTIALLPWVSEGGDTIGIEVVPPWEILPIPVEVDSSHKIRGLVRRKLVPITWLQELEGVQDKNADVWKKMETVEVPIGIIHPEGKSRFQGSAVLGGVGDATAMTYPTMDQKPGGGKYTRDKTKVKVVEAAEIWTKTSDNYWGEYLLYAGGYLLARTDYKGMKKQFPPQVITDVDVGDFWGRSFVDTLIPLNTEMEEMIARQFQNLKDADLYGMLMWPTTAGTNMRIIRGADGVKVAAYEPDPIAPEHKPYNIAPTKTGTLPYNLVKFGAELQAGIAQQPTALMGGDAPGRVDSASGLGFLYESSNVPLTPTAKAIARAFSNCYKVALDITRTMWKDDKLLDITHLDDSIAGIQLDPSSGMVKLSENSIPHPDDVVVGVMSSVPKSKEQMKQELKDAMDSQRITLTEYNIKVRKEGLELPVGNEQEWQNYRRATLENIMLFGDGVTPGQVIYTDRDMHMVHLMVLDAFMARPEFFLASEDVRTAFVEHRMEHEAGLGKIPEQLPLMDDAAAQTIMQMEGGGGGAPMM